jgi:broad specificity phosphatase PhoE
LIIQSKVNAPLYFIRHGETDWNIERRFQGQSDIPLNRHGIEQAAENGNILAGLLEKENGLFSHHHFVSSPLSRATKTMELIVSELGLPEYNYKTDAALTEISFGLWEGLTSPEAKQQYYQERQRRRLDRWAIAPPGGESFQDRVADVERFLLGLPANSVVVSHSGIMRIIIYLLKGLTPADAVKTNIPHIGAHIWDGISLSVIEK